MVCEGLRPEFSDPEVRARVLDFLLATNDRFNDFGKLQRRKKVTINKTKDVVRIVPASILRSVRNVTVPCEYPVARLWGDMCVLVECCTLLIEIVCKLVCPGAFSLVHHTTQ